MLRWHSRVVWELVTKVTRVVEMWLTVTCLLLVSETWPEGGARVEEERRVVVVIGNAQSKVKVGLTKLYSAHLTSKSQMKGKCAAEEIEKGTVPCDTWLFHYWVHGSHVRLRFPPRLFESLVDSQLLSAHCRACKVCRGKKVWLDKVMRSLSCPSELNLEETYFTA